MGQAITDYGKFLAEAREAVDSLNCDQNTYDQLAAEEIRLERELETAKRLWRTISARPPESGGMRSAPIMIRKSGRVRSA